MVLAHARALLTSTEAGATDYIDADLRDTGTILAQAGQILNFSQPVRVARFFEGTDLVEPGLVRIEEWRPDPGADSAGRSSLWCAVGRKR